MIAMLTSRGRNARLDKIDPLHCIALSCIIHDRQKEYGEVVQTSPWFTQTCKGGLNE